MPRFRIDDQVLEAPKGTVIIAAADQAGIYIPRFCYHPELSLVGSCRMCLVELEGSPKLVPACTTPVVDNLVVRTNTPKVIKARQGVMEFLLINHPLDCPVCDQAGECDLQDYSYVYGYARSRFVEDKIKQRKKDVGAQILLYSDRCILCSRCVRFCKEISGTSELCVIDRGAHCEIETYPGVRVDNALAGNVVDICPVGALLSKDFLFKCRVWYLQSTPSICPRCSRGCNIFVDTYQNVIQRFRPRRNLDVNRTWMCDLGRFGYKYVHHKDRLRQPLVRRGVKLVPVSWDAALNTVATRLRSIPKETLSQSVAGLGSPHLTDEENLAFFEFMVNKVGAQRAVPLLAVHDNFRVETEKRFPAGFVIDASKEANLRGAQAMLSKIELDPSRLRDVYGALDAGRIKFLYLLNGTPEGEAAYDLVSRARKADFLVVQDILPSPLALVADVVLPGVTAFEKSGTFVNSQGYRQKINRAINPLRGTKEDSEIIRLVAHSFESTAQVAAAGA